MIPKNTEKILRFLLRNSQKEGFNINQIAKFLEISVGSSFKILKELEKNNMVLAKKLGNATYYTINLENPGAIKLCELILLEEKRNLTGYAKLYSQELQSFDKAEMIILFGSVLEKKDFNDIDVLFMTSNIKSVNEFCLKLSKTRSKPVVPLILKKEDIINELKNKKDVILSIMKNGIIMKGESIFIEVIKNARN